MTASPKLLYKRVLIKVSGEALMGDRPHGIDMATLKRIARDVSAAVALGAEIALVVGGGNIYRGLSGAADGMSRVTGDYMGMLATVMNGLAVQNALEAAGTPARVLSAIPMPTVCEPFTTNRALRHLEKGRVVVFSGGTGNPFFTTDTAAALRASEMACDALVKATQVDGVYSADPKHDTTAERFDRLTYRDVLSRDLQVMDAAAIALARDNDIPIIVFSIGNEGNMPKVLQGEGKYTTIGS